MFNSTPTASAARLRAAEERAAQAEEEQARAEAEATLEEAQAEAEALRLELEALSSTQRAAVLMLLLGEQQASEILRYMNPKEVQALGAAPIGGGFDFSGAVDLMVFCNGPWCDQGPRAIRHLISAGYPAAKLHYYRGGMQDWLILGLTTIQPASNG